MLFRSDDIRVLDIIGVVNMDGEHRVFEEFANKFGFLDALFGQLGKSTSESEANLTLLECAEQYPAYVLEILPDDETACQCATIAKK